MIRLFLAGDVMTGRGIDQILPYPSPPEIFEDDITSALDYVWLAERAHGAIHRSVGFDYIWGDALDVIEEFDPHARIVNLETAITRSDDAEPKGINYRMTPANIRVLTTAGINCCALANNHVLDWGRWGLLETLGALNGVHILTPGAGGDLDEASLPAIIRVAPSSRVLVFAVGMESSGIPPFWAAGNETPGVRFISRPSAGSAEALAEEVLRTRRPGDIVVISVHWGSNWGYDVSTAQTEFARCLVDLGACDLLHGHSSHHARRLEIYRNKLILYGCGDFINDYEGIKGHEQYRGDLAPAYFASINERDGNLEDLQIMLFRLRRFRLSRAPLEDIWWFQSTLNEQCAPFGTQLIMNRHESLRAVPTISRESHTRRRRAQGHDRSERRLIP